MKMIKIIVKIRKHLYIAFIPILALVTGCSFLQGSTSNLHDKDNITVAAEIYEAEKNPVTVTPIETMIVSPTPTPQELVVYKGQVEHIFFHPLVVYKEKAFDNDSLGKGYRDWFITVDEFKKILNSLYENNFILVDINDVYEVKEEKDNKRLSKKELILPRGKKPIIISIDDLNYYEYMINNGNAHKLILDSNGDIATFSIAPGGKEVISRDNEIVPIIDKFVDEHSDFSFRGAKGIIALTGYEGILGYRTNKYDSPEYENEKTEALRVVKRLKETGWSFASHGYGHLDARKISYEKTVRDNKRWKDEVESLIGPTNVYIYPFGSALPYKDKRLKYLLSEGFNIFCGVGAEWLVETHPDCVIIDRRPIDGVSFTYHSESYKNFFNTDEVIDSFRLTPGADK